jgi:catechol 2,3-dioxygenase-like lactoylglutathione lyase family enzyme
VKLEHFAVVCSSLENSDTFYQDILGLEKRKDTSIPPDLSDKIFGIAVECRLLLYSNTNLSVEVFIIQGGQRRKASFEHVCLSVKDKKSFTEKCRVEGCEINLVPRGDYLLTFIRDFDGNLFEIKEIEN